MRASRKNFIGFYVSLWILWPKSGHYHPSANANPNVWFPRGTQCPSESINLLNHTFIFQRVEHILSIIFASEFVTFSTSASSFSQSVSGQLFIRVWTSIKVSFKGVKSDFEGFFTCNNHPHWKIGGKNSLYYLMIVKKLWGPRAK